MASNTRGVTGSVKRALNGWGWKLTVALGSVVLTMAAGWLAFAGDVMMKDEYERHQAPLLKQLDRNTDAITDMSKSLSELVATQREQIRHTMARESDYRLEQRAIRDRIDRILDHIAKPK